MLAPKPIGFFGSSGSSWLPMARAIDPALWSSAWICRSVRSAWSSRISTSPTAILIFTMEAFSEHQIGHAVEIVITIVGMAAPSYLQ